MTTVKELIDMLSFFPMDMEVQLGKKGWADISHEIDRVQVEHRAAYKKVFVVIKPEPDKP